MNFVMKPSLFGFAVVTRAALAFGVGLLVADRIPKARRQAIARALIGVGAATTIPIVRAVWAHRAERPALARAL